MPKRGQATTVKERRLNKLCSKVKENTTSVRIAHGKTPTLYNTRSCNGCRHLVYTGKIPLPKCVCGLLIASPS